MFSSTPTLMQQALTHIKSGKFSYEANQKLMWAIVHYIATAKNSSQLVEELKSDMKALQITESNSIVAPLLHTVSDPMILDGVRKNPKFSNYSVEKFQEEIDLAINVDKQANKANKEFVERFGLRLTSI